jgi:hypothetical protein
LFKGGEHRLDGGGLEQPAGLPVLYDDFAERTAAAHLAGDGHQDYIAADAVIGGAGYDDAGTLLAVGLVGERKGHQDDITKLLGYECGLVRPWQCGAYRRS